MPWDPTIASASGFADGSGTQLDASAPVSFLPGDLIVAWSKHEGADTTFAVASSAGGHDLTFNPADERNAAGGFAGAFGYLIATVAGTNVTFRQTLGAARDFRRLIVSVARPVAGMLVTRVAGANAEAVSTAPNSGNITVPTADCITYGGFAEFSATTTSSELINGVAATEVSASPANSQTSLWYRVTSTGFTGAASATAGSGDWICGVIAFKAAAPPPTPGDNLAFAHGAVQWLAADAATTVYTVSGLPFQPKALRFYWQGLGSATDAVSDTVHLRRGVGFATGTSARRCVGSQDQDAAATSVCTTGYRDDCVAMTLTSTPAADGLLDLGSITADGFTLVVDDQAPVNVTVFWEAWGGDAVADAAVLDIAEPAATGNVDYSVSFQPDVVMFAGVQATGAAQTAARNDSGLMVGFASGVNSADNVVVVGNSDDASTAMDTDGYCKTGECLAMIVVAGGNPNARAQLTAFSSDGFRLNWIARATTNRRYIGLAIRGGRWKAGAYTINGNSAAATATVSGLTFRPNGISLIGTRATESTAGTAVANDRMGLGTGSSPTSRRSMGSLSEDATASSNCEVDLTVQYDQVLSYPDAAGALVAAYDINAVNEDGFQIIVDTAGGVASEWQGYLAFGNNPPTIVQLTPSSIRRAA